MKQTTLAAEQFGAAAQAYLGSKVHVQGADLQRLSLQLFRFFENLQML